MNLPSDCVFNEIFKHLNGFDLLKIQRVCKLWNRQVNDRQWLWRERCEREANDKLILLKRDWKTAWIKLHSDKHMKDLKIIKQRMKNANETKDLNVAGLVKVVIPLSIFEVESLRVLRVNNNGWTFIPQQICRLTKLEKLRISYNQLTELPPFLSQLVNLQYLHVGGNKIISIAPELSNLRLKTDGGCSRR